VQTSVIYFISPFLGVNLQSLVWHIIRASMLAQLFGN